MPSPLYADELEGGGALPAPSAIAKPAGDVDEESGEFFDLADEIEGGEQPGGEGSGGGLEIAATATATATASRPTRPSRIMLGRPSVNSIQDMRMKFSGRSGTDKLCKWSVRFDVDYQRKTVRKRMSCSRMVSRSRRAFFRTTEALEEMWQRKCHRFVALASLFELWSLGVWIGFLREPLMAGTLVMISAIDMFCNAIYVVDSTFQILTIYIEEWKANILAQRKAASQHRKNKHGQEKNAARRRPSIQARPSLKEQHDAQKAHQLRAQAALDVQKSMIGRIRQSVLYRERKVLAGVFLAIGMFPLQVQMYMTLENGDEITWSSSFFLAVRILRVLWVFRQCLASLSQQELEVYVDIKMHGTAASSGNRARILMKTFVVICFVGHWFGCLVYVLHEDGGLLQSGARPHVATRDYFEQFQDESNVWYIEGESFLCSYILSLYKGFNLNIEDIRPERPIELISEVFFSISILLMKSYCIGSFFKFHQKREFEVHRFAKLMQSVLQYLDLYDMPPSLRKTVINHFKFQQANHRKIRTLEVISGLPISVQKNLREFEVLPTISDRNPALFGTLSTEYCMRIAMQLATQYLQAGEVIFVEREVPRELVFLDSGAVSLSRTAVVDGRHAEQLMRYVRADRKDDPTALGAEALVLGCQHFFSARVRAGNEVVILSMTSVDFAELNAHFEKQIEHLIHNVAAAYRFDVRGNDLYGHEKNEQETDADAAIRADVRRVLLGRQATMETALMYAASNGDTKLVKEMLAKGVNPNCADYDGRSALHLAASEGRSDVLQILLEHGGDPNLKDRWGSTPMQDGLKNRFMLAAKILQQQGGSLQLADPAGELCTHASEGNTIAMQQLIDFGVDMNAGDYDGRTALHLAASEGHLPVVTFLTSRGADVNVRDRWNATPVQDAVRNGYSIVAAHLCSHGSSINADFAATMVFDAAARGDLEMLKLLFESKVDMDRGNYDSRTALHFAAVEGKVLALNYLLNTARASHSPVDRWGATPLQDAISKDNDLCIQLLMNAGAALGPTADTAMHDKVAAMSKAMGFGTRNGMTQFSQASQALRRKLSSHIQLVKQGRARGDIFDCKAAAHFNRLVITTCIKKMGPLCKDAVWLADSLHSFQAAAEPLWQFVRVLSAAEGLNTEVSFWKETSKFEKRLPTAQRSKDAEDMAFHKAFLAGMRFCSGLNAMHEAVADRLVTRVRQICVDAQRPGVAKAKTVPLSVMIAQEVLAEMGIHRESDDGKEVAKIRNRANDGTEINKAALAERLEQVARVLLTGNHLSMALFKGALAMHGTGVPTPLNTPALGVRGRNPALRPLEHWLNLRTRTALSGTDPGPGLPPAAQKVDAVALYGALCPPPGPHIRVSQQKAEGSAVGPETVVTSLVAQELAMLAITALVLDGWDRDLQTTEYQREEMKRERLISSQLATGRGLDVKHTSVTQDDLQDLGRICRETAAVCRGRYVDDPEERKEVLRRLRRKVREDKAKAKRFDDEGDQKDQKEGGEKEPQVVSATALEGQEAAQADDALADEEPTEDLPIRVSKILALDKMSVDEIGTLIDVSDFDAPTGSGGRASILSDLSRERFVFNMVRIILSHDESQRDLCAAAQEWQAEQEANEERDTIGSDSTAVSGSIAGSKIPVGAELEELYKEVDWMAREFSEGSESTGEQAEAAPLFMYGAIGGQTRLIDGGSQVLEEKANEKLTFMGLLCMVVKFFGKEGRTRRRQRRIAKRFRELDDDGDGIGTQEVAQLLALAFNHTLGLEQELRYAYRVFELLEKADVGDLVMLPELLEVLPKLEEEIKDQQRKNRRTASAADNSENSAWLITRVASRLVYTPDSKFLKWWDKARILVVVYYMMEVPVHFSFLGMVHMPEESAKVWHALNIAADAFMGLNILLTFFRGFVHETKGIVTTFQDIRISYVFGPFWIDVLACCPLDYWVAEEDGVTNFLSRPRAGLRMLRLFHARHFVTRSAKSHGNDAARGFVVAAVQMALMIITVVHFLACAYWMVGTRYDMFESDETWYFADHQYDKHHHDDVLQDRGNWMNGYIHRPGESPIGDWSGVTPFWWQYLVAFYVCTGRVTSQLGSGNIVPGSWLELGFIVSFFILNVAIIGYCDGILVDKVIAGDESAIEAKAMRRIVDDYLQNTDLPQELIKDVQHSAQECGKVVERERMELLISTLPHTLKQRIAKRVFLPKLGTPLFEVCSESFLVELGAQSRIMVFGKDQPLAIEGAPADRLNVLVQGRIAIVSEGTQLAETQSPGEMVGEMPFIFDLKHVVSIVALEESRLMVLEKASFLATCKLYPEDSLALKRSAMKVIANLNGDMADEERSRSNTQLSKSKSAMSFATNRSSGSSTSMGSRSSTVSDALRRLYAGDLKLVVDKLRQEQAAARQELVGHFIQLAADGDIAAVEATLQKGEVHVDEADYDARTALHLAVCNNRVQMVKLLLEKYGASISVKDRFGHSPVDDAVREKRVEIVRYLVSLGAEYQVSTDVAATLCQAAYDGDIRLLTMMLADVEVNPNVGDYDKRTPLHLAASEGRLDVVQLLVGLPKIELSPRDRLGNTPLDDAIRHKHSGVREFLYKAGACIGDKLMGPELCEVAFSGDLPHLRELAASGVDLNEADYDARTALHICASENCLPMMTYLLEEVGVDPNPLDRFFHTPLDDAIRHGHRAMQAFLKVRGGKSGSDPDLKHAVENFQKQKKLADAQHAHAKLEREARSTEVSSVQEKLAWFRANLNLEDDMYSFASYAASFRTLLLTLVLQSVDPKEYIDDKQSDTGQSNKGKLLEEFDLFNTKEQRERMVNKFANELDATCGKLVSTLEAEVMPWLNGLNRHEDRLLRILAPNLKPMISHIMENMKSRVSLKRFLAMLWQHEGDTGGNYHCAPIGFLMQRLVGGPDDFAVLRARLEASALLWASGNAASGGSVSVASPAASPAASPPRSPRPPGRLAATPAASTNASPAASTAPSPNASPRAGERPGAANAGAKGAVAKTSSSHRGSGLLLAMVEDDTSPSGSGKVADLSHTAFL